MKTCLPSGMKIYHLSTCSTCQRIIKELGLGKEFEFQDIKTEKITAAQLDEMKAMTGSYEALFSRIALKYRAMGLNTKQLSEKDYRQLILDEYTFLKRPIIIIGKKIFVGNSQNNIEKVKEEIRK